MEDWQREHLRDQLQKSIELKLQFFLLQEESKLQLVSNQFQYFQSLGAIGFAAAALIIGSNTINLSIWWLLMGLTALLLVIYSSTSVRELNDAYSHRLELEEIGIEESHTDLENVVKETIDKNNFTIYENFIASRKRKTRDRTQSYAGEIAIFLLFLTIVFGVLGAILEYTQNPCIYVFAAPGVLIAIMLAFMDWNLTITRLISKPVHYLLGKNNIQS